MKTVKRALPVLLAVLLILQTTPAAAAADSTAAAAARCASYLLSAVDAPQVGSVGGDWTVIALARGNAEVPQEYWERYFAAVKEYTAACGGVLHQRKYTEYSRVSLALTAIGADPADVGGYDLLAPLGDYEKTTWQGINGAIWALIALDSGGYDVPAAPEGKTQATRQRYVEAILARQLTDGGWNMTGAGDADPDLTAMALQALAGYRQQPAVQDAVDRAVECLSKLQNGSGGYATQGVVTAESTAQVIQALCSLGISLNDPRFIKGGSSLLDDLLSYQQADGSFRHTAGGSGSSLMATEQALCALDAALRAETGEAGLYQMTDTKIAVGRTPLTSEALWQRIAYSGCVLARSVVLAAAVR
ncbi:prenyltransferase/squalene oxidase repeat-containing protein [Dysosmobacter sp.]|uniref:prenyltransferase/squalene oxidase repeat-containing protein n=1 Tax=Dysosmobacter sp. TaxID=2591382 RepID=UPI002A8BDA10|nr:prenyltransferase/squalene oxidase repeat-containing protein [Dysosmobacter sp.]MDY3282409.1 prenyltransferase/squalene oxidase repeat-containing protein [Dysosmobacter sp.]